MIDIMVGVGKLLGLTLQLYTFSTAIGFGLTSGLIIAAKWLLQ